MNAIIYINKTGCHWRLLPHDFAPWQTVYFYFRKWKFEGVIEEIVEALRGLCRKKAGKKNLQVWELLILEVSKHLIMLDSDRGIDGNKKIKGRKEHIIVDTLGLPMSIKIQPANIHDSKGAYDVIKNLSCKFPRLSKIIADGGYRGSLADWTYDKFGWILEVVLRPDECPSKFSVIPKRWIVERTFSWLENYRRIALDYEYSSESAEAMVQVSFIQIMLNRFFK